MVIEVERGDSLPGRVPRLHEQIARELERRIASGRLGSGEHLTEVRVARDFGVSRAPVRIALRRLEEKGLLGRDARRGFRIRPAAGSRPARGALGEASDAPVALDSSASWEGIYRDLSRKAVARAAYGSWSINETELARSYAVSRTVAREVLARLEHVGIIAKNARSRWSLPALTPARVTQLYEMRWILEPIALRNAAGRVPRALLEAMRDELEAALARPDRVPPRELDRLEQRLHVELLSHGDNLVLIETLQHYHALLITNAHLYEATHAAFGADPFIGEHLDIVRALLRGEVEAAAKRIEDHLRVALPRALDRIDHMVRHRTFDPLPYLRPLDGAG